MASRTRAQRLPNRLCACFERSTGFLDGDVAIDGQVVEHLLGSAGPANRQAGNLAASAKPEMEAWIVSRDVAPSIAYRIKKLDTARRQPNRSADRIAITLCAAQRKTHPPTRRFCFVVKKQRLACDWKNGDVHQSVVIVVGNCRPTIRIVGGRRI